MSAEIAESTLGYNLKTRQQRRRKRKRRRKRRKRRETRKRKRWRRRKWVDKQEEVVVGGQRDPEAAEMEKKKTLTVTTLIHTVENFFRLELEIPPFGFCAP